MLNDIFSDQLIWSGRLFDQVPGEKETTLTSALEVSTTSLSQLESLNYHRVVD